VIFNVPTARPTAHLTKPTVKLLVVIILAPLVFAHGAGVREPGALGRSVAVAARQQIGVTKEYDPAYVSLGYPGGDVPVHTGVCSDVVVRALRRIGIDLQKEIHEDMRENFRVYPQKWGLKKPDRNIDHRRVANLMRYFERHQVALRESLQSEESYRPGDIVAWDLGKGILHVGVVSDRAAGRTPLIIHNIGNGTREENILFRYRVIGHYRIKEGAPPWRAKSLTAGATQLLLS
jgi:uncharacterized protein YijF (DUF1287 family)